MGSNGVASARDKEGINLLRFSRMQNYVDTMLVRLRRTAQAGTIAASKYIKKGIQSTHIRRTLHISWTNTIMLRLTFSRPNTECRQPTWNVSRHSSLSMPTTGNLATQQRLPICHPNPIPPISPSTTTPPLRLLLRPSDPSKSTRVHKSHIPIRFLPSLFSSLPTTCI